MLHDQRDIAWRVMTRYGDRIVRRDRAGFLIREERTNWLLCFVCAHTGRIFRTPNGKPTARPGALTVQHGSVFDN